MILGFSGIFWDVFNYDALIWHECGMTGGVGGGRGSYVFLTFHGDSHEFTWNS